MLGRVLYSDTNSFILMNRDRYIDVYTHTLRVKWPVDKCFHTVASKIFKSKGWYFD